MNKLKVVLKCFFLILILSPLACTSLDGLIKKGKFDEAEKFILEQDEEKKLKYFAVLADAYLAKGDYENAEKFYLKSDDINLGYTKIADAYLDNGDYQNAEKYYLKSQNANMGYTKIGDAYLDEGDYQNAENYYLKSDKVNQGYVKIANNFIRQKNYPKAKSYYEKSGRFYSIKDLEIIYASMMDTTQIMLPKTPYGSESVKPYGDRKLITLFNTEILEGNKIQFSYISEKELKEEMVLISLYTRGETGGWFLICNYAGDTLSKVEYKDYYIISEQTIICYPHLSKEISDSAKVRLFFITKNEISSIVNNKKQILAVSNVITLFINFIEGLPDKIEL